MPRKRIVPTPDGMWRMVPTGKDPIDAYRTKNKAPVAGDESKHDPQGDGDSPIVTGPQNDLDLTPRPDLL